YDDGREDLKPHQCRVWMPGPPPFHWSLSPLPPDPVHPKDVPVGCSIHVDDFGSTRTTKEPWEESKDRWVTEVALFPEFEEKREVCLNDDTVHILPTGGWPEVRYELTIEGETAEGSQEEMEALRRWAVAALEDEWRRNLYAAAATEPALSEVPA
ncbi:MAG TPA: hypothetical protein VMS11_01850, partial [Solirubrobacterales bacterium]|nr:hypothetical protein [Solirubrobacterales bacterium]